MCEILMNRELNGVEIYFGVGNKPSKEVIADLKSVGFRWHVGKVCWYARQSQKTIEKANQYKDYSIELKAPVKEVKNNIIDLFELTTYIEDKKEKSHDTKAITKEIRSALKKRFKFVKFSITCPYSHRIDIEIKSSPFEKDSIYLNSIIEYCKKFVDSYNYCTCYDPYGDYGSSYNFYSSISVDYDYIQTELKYIEKVMTLFDEKKADADRMYKEKQDAEYQEYLKEQEIKHKEYEERKAREEKEIQAINNNVKIVDLKDNEQYYVLNSQFANCNKNSTLAEYQEEIKQNDFYNRDCRVEKEIYFNDESIYNYFSNLLLNDFNFLSETGGSYTDDNRVNTMEDYYNMSKAEKDSVKWLNQVVAIYLNNKLMFIIDAQGYSYARYVGLIGENTVVTKKFEYKQEISEEIISERKEIANTTINIINEAIEKNSIDINDSETWAVNRKILVNEIKQNKIKLCKEIIQQVQEKNYHIKNALYRCIKECDSVINQFKDANIKEGQKLTIIKLSMLGGCSSSHIEYKGSEITGDSVKITCNIKGKRGSYTTTLSDKDILIYEGWIDINNLLWIATEGGKATKYGSYDKQCLDDIINYYDNKGIRPIISTYKPVF